MSGIKYFILILIIQTIKTKKINYLSLPFLQYSSPEDFSESIQTDYFINMNIGNPPQKLPLYLSQSLFMTYISSKESQAQKAGTKYFDWEKSTSYHHNESKQFTYKNNEFKKAYNGYDELKNVMNNFSFLLITLYEDMIMDFYPGKLGLKGLGNEEENTQFLKHNFMHQLINNNIISKSIFTFHFENSTNGNLIFGAYPHEYNNLYDKNYLTSFNGLTNKEWGINFDSINYDGHEFICIKKGHFLIEFGLIKAPKNLIDPFQKYFFNYYIDKKICSLSSLGYYHFVCDLSFNKSDFKNINLKLNNENFTFVLDNEMLFETYNNKIYFLLVFGEGNWIFGKPFLQKYEITFDSDNGQIIWYNKKKNKTTNYLLIIIAVFAFIIVILSGIIIYNIYLKINKRKKRAHELNEDFIYDSTEKINTDIGPIE